MNRVLPVVVVLLNLVAASLAQTTVTTSGGTATTIPLFTGSSVLGNSAITQSSGRIGIGTTTPNQLFSVGSGSPFQVDSGGNTFQLPSTAATSAMNYGSPSHYFSGNYWNGSSSATDSWIIQGALDPTPTSASTLNFSHTGSSGGPSGPLVNMNAPFYVNNGFTSSAFQNAVGVNSTITYSPTISTNFTTHVYASINAVNLKLLGAGVDTSGYVGVQFNQFKQITGSGGISSGAVQNNIFEVDAGSTTYGNMAVSEASASIGGGSGNIGTLSLFGASLAGLPGSYTGTISNLYGLYLPNIAGATNNYAIYSIGGQSYFGGNMGVGVTVPTQKLEVNGNVKIDGSGSAIIFPDGTTQASAAKTGTSVIADGSGNVGIGTSTPGAKLAVVGGALAATAGSTLNLLTLQSSNANQSYLNIGQQRNTAGNDWTTATTRLQLVTDVTKQGYIDLNPSGGQGAVALGSGSTESLRILASGVVGIGTTVPSSSARMEVNGTIKLTAGSGASIIFQDGSTQATAYTGVTCGGDYAESIAPSGDRKSYEPGDVLVIDPSNEGQFLKSSSPYSSMVAGIYSTKPGITGRRQTSDISNVKDEIPMAMVGIVPAKVTAENGPIKVGDLLVSSSRVGYAMKGTNRGLMLGAVVGKALGHLDSGTGIVEVVVSLQ